MKIKAKIIIFIAPELIIFKCAVAETETLFLSVDFSQLVDFRLYSEKV